MIEYTPQGVCAQSIRVDLENNVVKQVEFIGGCNGNLKGIASLVVGMDAREAISRIDGLTCGNKATSCPDQLAQALKAALRQSF